MWNPINWLVVLLSMSCISYMFVDSQTVEGLDALQPVWTANTNPIQQSVPQTPQTLPAIPQPYITQAQQQGQGQVLGQGQTYYTPLGQTYYTPITPSFVPQPTFTPTPAPTPIPTAAPPLAPANGPLVSAGPILTPFPGGIVSTEDTKICRFEEMEYYNLTRSVLERFCTVASLTDLRSLDEKDISTCCAIDRSIISDVCFNACAEEENAFDPVVVLVDLWRAVCRIQKISCADSAAVQKVSVQDTLAASPVPIQGSAPLTPTQSQTPAPTPGSITSATTTDQISLSSIFDAVPGLSLLATYLRNADLLRLLEDPGTVVTFFAPTNAAFRRFSQTYNIPLEDLEQVPGWFEVLLYHIVGGTQNVGQIPPTQLTPMTTAQGNTIMLLGSQISSCCVQGNTAQILVPDTVVSNGMFHVINNVLLPFSVV